MIIIGWNAQNGRSTLSLCITTHAKHVNNRRGFPPVKYISIDYSGSLPSYMILISPYTLAQFRIVVVHFFVASKVAKYRAFNRAVSLGNTLL